ncbi:hypothetical protein [Ktedonobacter racemifer]|nr:hypothetical protein [Ktedonobacter racemifer]
MDTLTREEENDHDDDPTLLFHIIDRPELAVERNPLLCVNVKGIVGSSSI